MRNTEMWISMLFWDLTIGTKEDVRWGRGEKGKTHDKFHNCITSATSKWSNFFQLALFTAVSHIHTFYISFFH